MPGARCNTEPRRHGDRPREAQIAVGHIGRDTAITIILHDKCFQGGGIQGAVRKSGVKEAKRLPRRAEL